MQIFRKIDRKKNKNFSFENLEQCFCARLYYNIFYDLLAYATNHEFPRSSAISSQYWIERKISEQKTHRRNQFDPFAEVANERSQFCPIYRLHYTFHDHDHNPFTIPMILTAWDRSRYERSQKRLCCPSPVCMQLFFSQVLAEKSYRG